MREITLEVCVWCSKRIKTGELIAEMEGGRKIHLHCREEVRRILDAPTKVAS